MTARDLSPTERRIRDIVADHLPRVDADRRASYAGLIHLDTPLVLLGIADGVAVATGLAIEHAFGIEPTDDELEACKTPRHFAALVERHARAVAA